MSRIILSVETSSTICSTAIIENGEILSCVEEVCPREHIEKLPGFVKKAFDQSNKTVSNIDAIAVSIGPGSFTGLRIGLGFSKGMAFSRGLPIIPVPTMLSLAYSLKDKEPKNGILFSHSKKVFYQCFEWKNNIPSVKGNAIVTDIESIMEKEELDFHSNCERFFQDDVKIISASHSSRHIALLASKFYDDWLIKKPYELVPDYIAPFIIKTSAK
jgi:tRNA threonylcarbamoyl adenosine modification protein YeaZ